MQPTEITKPKKEKQEVEIMQANVVTNARYELTAMEKRIVYMMTAQFKENRNNKDLFNKTVFTIDVRDIIDGTASKTTNYKHIRDACTKLLSRPYEVKKNVNGQKSWLKFNLISSAEYFLGIGKIELGVDEKILPIFRDISSGFTKYNLDIAMTLKSVYSQRFYEFLSQYSNTGFWRVGIDELRAMLKLETKYRSHSTFMKKVVEVAQKELEKVVNLKFNVEQIKEGRKVVELQFRFKRFDVTTENKENAISAEVENTPTYLSLIRMGLSQWQVKQIFNNVPDKEVKKMVYDLKLHIQDNNITNQGAYVWSAFKKAYNLGDNGNN